MILAEMLWLNHLSLAVLLFHVASLASNITIGIIGAGISGLYTAILLQSLGIDFEILEASNRNGGRIWTHYFDHDGWKASLPGQPQYYNYFEVGAMRIPQTKFMQRIVGAERYSLINYVNTHMHQSSKLKLIPFIFSNPNTFEYFNHVLKSSRENLQGDVFRTGLSAFAQSSPESVWNGIIQKFTSSLSANFVQGLIKVTSLGQSVRQYLSSMGLSFLEINWLETFVDATGHFDLDIAEIILEDWVFGADQTNVSWVTVEGGMSRLTEAMSGLLNGTIQYSQRVDAIEQTDDTARLHVHTKTGNDHTYDHVISTASLSSVQEIDMRSLDLDDTQSAAIRMINYDAAMKIGIKFKTRWWQNLPQPIYGGQSFSDLPIRTCVYPSYGINVTNAAAILIVSYTWAQDASRLAGYLNSQTSEAELVDLALANLAALHQRNISLAFLRSQYVTHFAYSWSNDEYALGAFPAFAPGQFTGLMPALAKPAGRSRRLHFGGDAVSVGHAWMVGALDSAYRCVEEVLQVEGREDLLSELKRQWGVLDYNVSSIFNGLSTITPAADSQTS